ncbi:hypothetical protein FB446DRAFT_847814 [Lentinula raphanica]|nr:hypothetical protein FB446DRAFT_847814 [Lentinula raphanica]
MNLYRLLFFVTLAVRVSSTDLETDSLFSRRSIQEVGVESHSDRHGHHQSTLSARVNANANAIEDGPNHHHQPSSHDIELRPYSTVAQSPHYPVTHPSPIHPSHRVQFSDSASLPPNYESVALTGPPPYSEPTSGYVNAVGHAWPGEVHEQGSSLSPPALLRNQNQDLRRHCARLRRNHLKCKYILIASACVVATAGGLTYLVLSRLQEVASACPANGQPASSGWQCGTSTTSNPTLKRRGVSGSKKESEEQKNCYVELTEDSCDCKPDTMEVVIPANGKIPKSGGDVKHTKREVLKSIYRPRM